MTRKREKMTAETFAFFDARERDEITTGTGTYWRGSGARRADRDREFYAPMDADETPQWWPEC